MEAGSVVKIAFVQADNKIKFRPAVILKEFKPYHDYLVCGISSNIGLEVKGFDIVIDEHNPDFQTWGLTHRGLIRLGFLQTIPGNMISGVIGNISSETHRKLVKNLAGYLTE
ncbi:MAG TPA: type II toxin-antitoxin system PemK/MazF family toxin [Bacteroidia bacterium]|nr:type II toxin-antitoxin system PemK/MazF family toxin [Bacteroidia bacterium]